MRDLVSIIIPVYNSELYIKACIMSLTKQSYEDIEIIIVNDGSVDKSQEIIEEYQKKDKRIKLINKGHVGVSEARNLGIQVAKGKYVAFCDADDIVHEKFIEILLETIKYNDSDIAIVDYTRCYSQLGSVDNDIKVMDKNDTVCLVINGNGFLWNKLLKLSVIKENNIYFESEIDICEDQLFLIEYLKYTNTVNLNKSIMYYYRQVKNSALNSKKMTSAKLSEIIAREKSFYMICKNNFSEKCVNASLYSLLCSYCYFTKDLLLKSKDKGFRKIWLKYISNNFMKVKKQKKVKIYNVRGIKLRIYYVLLFIISNYFYLKASFRVGGTHIPN